MLFSEKKINRRLALGFEHSLASTLGESGAEAVMRLGQIPGDKLDSIAIDSSLNLVFGASSEGLSAVQTRVLDGMSTRLGVELPKESGEFGFYSSLETLSERYRLKEMTGFGIAGVVASAISSICCLGPIAFALLGFASLSASLSLAMDLTSTYQPVELAGALGFLGATIYFQLRRQNQCSLDGLRRNLAYIIIPGTTLLVSYAIINYWIGVTFFGHPLKLIP
jgi:hypothetical protein